LIRRLALVVLLVAGGAVGAMAQDTIQLRDPGPSGAPAVLVQALASSYVVMSPAGTRALLARDTTYARTVIVLGRDAIVEGTVHGDVIVIGGDLYMHPGGEITGRAVAIGGGVYESTAARIGGGVQANRAFTYEIARVSGGWSLTYRELETSEEEPLIQGTYGLRVPTYDRSDGLSLADAPSFKPPHTHIRIEPRVTYRSQLGRLDPSLIIADSLDRRTALQLSVGRSTFTNDAWIWTDLVNSLEALWRGDDSRNYFRATRAELTLGRRWKSPTTTFTPYVGGRFERANSVRPGLDAASEPWSFIGRHDIDDMLRPNPAVDPGTTGSVLAGFEINWTPSDITARLRVDEELGAFNQDCGGCDLQQGEDFAQITLDGGITFPTFGTQRFRVDAHAVITSHGATPPQRWAYVGGSGSIPTLDMLSRGGDQLAFLDARYDIPIDGAALPFAGPPVVTLREVLGGAALGRFPTLAQASGVRLSGGFLYVEWLIDPVSHHTHVSYGVSIAR
jgi:hypothetical protein